MGFWRYAGRIRILLRSWNTAAKKGETVEQFEDLESKSDEEEEEEEVAQEHVQADAARFEALNARKLDETCGFRGQQDEPRGHW